MRIALVVAFVLSVVTGMSVVAEQYVGLVNELHAQEAPRCPC